MWRKVTESDLTVSLSAKEIENYRRSAEFDSDPIDGQIRAVCAYVRGCVRTGGSSVRMARAEDWLPESLISPAMDYLRFGILTRMDIVVNESRTEAYKNALAIFDQLRRGEFVPESDSSDPEPVEPDPSDRATSPVAADATPERLLD